MALRGVTCSAVGLAQEAARELADVVGVGRREHQVLALLRQHLEHALDVADEAHVEHAVRFVEHEDLHFGERHGALLAQVEQAARRRDQDVAAMPRLVDLRFLGDAAEDDQRAQVAVLAVVDDALRDLRGELARRREHQRARIASAAGAELLQHRQREAGGLAGAGLRAGEHVAAGEHGGNRLGLDGGGNGVALVGHGTEQLGLEPESFK